jgi:hypothetical protein
MTHDCYALFVGVCVFLFWGYGWWIQMFKRSCTNRRCATSIRAGEFACVSCWERLPKEIRADVFNSWDNSGWHSEGYKRAIGIARTWWEGHL